MKKREISEDKSLTLFSLKVSLLPTHYFIQRRFFSCLRVLVFLCGVFVSLFPKLFEVSEIASIFKDRSNDHLFPWIRTIPIQHIMLVSHYISDLEDTRYPYLSYRLIRTFATG